MPFSDSEYRLIELRGVDIENCGMVVEGRAVMYETPTLLKDKNGKAFTEIISRGALDEAIMDNIPMRYNHNAKGDYPILARTRNNSLELIKDEDGLLIRATLIDEKIYNSIKSGLLDGMSFGFYPPKKENVQWRFNTPDGVPERRINKIDKLSDVSVVDDPAYQATSIYARSFELLDNELRALDNEKNELEIEKIKTQIKLKG